MLDKEDLWEVFVQGRYSLPHRHVGSLHASDARIAMNNARDVYARRAEGRSLWVVRSKDIVASNPEKKEEMFDPAENKIYRHPTFFPIPEDIGPM